MALSLKKGTWQRLGWGPAWRFGHTMVDDPLRSRFILYGGEFRASAAAAEAPL